MSSQARNKDINDMTEKQLEYAANDVIYLHKIKKEYNIPLYSEVKDEIQKANAIAYKDSEQFEKKIELMKTLDIRIPKKMFISLLQKLK